MNTLTKTETRPRGSAVPWSVDLVVVGAAVVCALVLWVTVAVVGDVRLEVVTGGTTRQVGAGAVALAAAVAGLAGMGALRLLERLTPRALTVWTVLALVVLAASLLGPLGATSAAATGTLLGQHAVVAAVLLVAAYRSRAVWGARGPVAS